GGFATYFGVRADSSLVPSALSDQFTTDVSLRRGSLFDAGPMGGYVYTLVFNGHWFTTLSTVGGAGVAMQGLTHPDLLRDAEEYSFDAGIGYRLQLRAATGYNSARYYVGLSFNQ